MADKNSVRMNARNDFMRFLYKLLYPTIKIVDLIRHDKALISSIQDVLVCLSAY